MIHARTDYDPIQDPREGPSRIGDDEPVMLFRAKDRLAPEVLEAYYNLLIAAGADGEIAESVNRHINRMTAWQAAHKTKTPDMPAGTIRQP